MERPDLQNPTEQFLARVHQRLQRIDLLIAELRQDPADRERLAELLTMFHSLAGTGGTYGFYELSQQSRHGEWMCEAILQEQRTLEAPQLAALRALVKELEAALRKEKSVASAAMQEMMERTTEVPVFEVVVLEWFDEARERLIAQVHAAGLPARGVSTEGELLGSGRPLDAVITDAGPIVRNGFQLLKNLRSRPGGDKTAILLTGALPTFSDKVEVIRQGADAYFESTADCTAMLARLQELIERKQRRSGSILIVDDDQDQVRWLRAVLEGVGYQAFSCSDPRFFDQEVALAKPDLILLDIRMPGILGTDLARYIRQDEAWRTVPIIILTAIASDQARVQAALAGAEMHLQKPVEAPVLLSAVEGCLESARRRGTVMAIEVVAD